jgi:regulator of RNase E activity RraA
MSIPRDFEPVSPETLALLKEVSTATLSAQLLKRGYAQLYMHGVAPLRPDLRMAGQAFTLRFIPSREDLARDEQMASGEFNNLKNKQRIAVESVGAGEVMVIDARGDTRAASLGNILVARIKARGAAGIVTDGAFRDSPAIKAIDLPTFARGQSPNISFTVHYAADLNVPVSCGGVAVIPGDVIVGDAEGVVVLPAHLADELANEGVEMTAFEHFVTEEVQKGRSILGLYPPTDPETPGQFAAWRKANGR